MQIFDHVDRDVPTLGRMFEKRLRAYRGIGYAPGEAPLGTVNPWRRPSVEYDRTSSDP